MLLSRPILHVSTHTVFNNNMNLICFNAYIVTPYLLAIAFKAVP